MISDELGIQLHDRATRGEELTDGEQKQLENWYAVQDSAESSLLKSTTTEPDVSELRTQIEVVLSQLTAITQRIQQVMVENEKLRHEIAALHQQLASAKLA
jgi:predicted  nucleic acid-binding Zn-ribbon protein